MRYLLDTHAFIWWATQDPALPGTVRATIDDPAHETYFSAVSAWEIAIKAQLGQLALQGEVERLIPDQIAAGRFLTLPVEIRHALRVGTLPLLHRDPFDRLLVAQAQLEGLSVLTADHAIAQYDVAVAW